MHCFSLFLPTKEEWSENTGYRVKPEKEGIPNRLKDDRDVRQQLVIRRDGLPDQKPFHVFPIFRQFKDIRAVRIHPRNRAAFQQDRFQILRAQLFESEILFHDSGVRKPGFLPFLPGDTDTQTQACVLFGKVRRDPRTQSFRIPDDSRIGFDSAMSIRRQDRPVRKRNHAHDTCDRPGYTASLSYLGDLSFGSGYRDFHRASSCNNEVFGIARSIDTYRRPE